MYFFSSSMKKMSRYQRTLPAAAIFLFLVFFYIHNNYQEAPKQYNVKHYIIENDLKFLIQSNVCAKNLPYLVVLVPSHPDHTEARQVLRHLYNRKIRNRQISVVFICGDLKNSESQKTIAEESHQFGDIIQGNYPDSYRSISYFHLSGIYWAITKCSKAQYIMKADDDTFVNLMYILPELDKFDNSKNFMYCDPIYKARPNRDPDSKYYISQEEFQWKRYPTYCNGWSVVYPLHVGKQLLIKLSSTPFLWMSDVFVTGILAFHLPNMQHITMKPRYTWKIVEMEDWLNSSKKNLNKGKYLVGPTWGNVDFLRRLHKMVGTID